MEKANDLSFKLLDSRTKSTVKYQRVNELTGEEVPWDKIVKGYEYSKNNFIVMTDEDFKNAAAEATQLIEIENFVDKNEVTEEYFDKPYMLVPQKKAEKGYVLLREILEKSNRVGIAKVVIRTREYLAAMIPKGPGLMLNLLRFSQEIRQVDEFELPEEKPETYRVTDKELQLAQDLVDAQTVKWDPEAYKDEYRDKLMAWIELKAEKGEVEPIEKPDEEGVETATNVIDLVDLLRQSVQGKKSEEKETKAPAKKRKKA